MSNDSRRHMRPAHRRKYPHEQTWLQEFVGFHGTENAVRFCEEDLGGVSLARALQVLREGFVVSAEKCDGPGTICVVLYDFEEETTVVVKVHFISNEEVLTILSANEIRKSENEAYQSA